MSFSVVLCVLCGQMHCLSHGTVLPKPIFMLAVRDALP